MLGKMLESWKLMTFLMISSYVARFQDAGAQKNTRKGFF